MCSLLLQVPFKPVTVFITNLFIATVVIALSLPCLVGESDSLRSFLNKQYELVRSDNDFDMVLRNFDIGSIRRMIFERAKLRLTLTWHSTTNIYTLTERRLFIKIEVPYQVVIIFYYIDTIANTMSYIWRLFLANQLKHWQQYYYYMRFHNT